MEPEVILVDTDDRETGRAGKLAAHRAGLLHRAFSVFLVHGGRMLIQRRAAGKYHSAGLWANACCSHPRPGEGVEEAALQRLRQELGIRVPAVEELFTFVYRCPFDNGLTEYELDHVLLADWDGPVTPDPEEVGEVAWVSFADLKAALLRRPEEFAVWFLTAAPEVLRRVEGG